MKRTWMVLCLVAATLAGQSITSRIVGTVSDSSGAAVAGAAIVARNVDTNERIESRSGASGDYLLLNLKPGGYEVEVNAPGFKKYIRKGVRLQLEQESRLDVALELGQLSEAVTVEANVTTLETTTSSIGMVVNNRAILNLPLDTRNVFSLIYLTPGVSGSIGNNYNSLSFSVNGTRTSLMEIMTDGIPAGHPTVQGYSGISVFPSVDAIGEFKVEAENYSAEYGHSIGGVVNVVFKSGTNLFHGTAYEFIRNSVLDANNFFSNARGVGLPSFKRNQFGGVLDGPIKKDKTFFLVSTEFLRQRAFSSTTTTVPTALQRNGDFSQTFAANGQLIRIYNPFTTTTTGGAPSRSQFSGNRIPASQINGVAANILKYYPLPNTPGDRLTNANNFFAAGTDQNNITSWDVRLDHNISERQKLFGRYSNRVYETVPAVFFPTEIAVAQDRITQTNYMRNGVAGYTFTASPTLLFDARLGFGRTLYLYGNGGLGFLASSLGLPKAVDTAGNLPMFPRITAGGYVSLGDSDNRKNSFMTYSLLVGVTKVAGPHTWKAGWDGRMIRVNNRESRDTSGNYNFGAGFTQGPNPNTASATAGNGLASLLLGTGSGDLIQNFKDVASQSFYHAVYLQDDWRVTKRLTLNLGVRYDVDLPRTDRYNRMNYFDPSVTSPFASVVPGLKGGLVFVDGNNRYQYPVDTNNLAPRIGFAYQANDKTVFRGGWGNVYAPSPQQASGTVGPYGYRVQTDWVGSLDGITPYNTLSNPFPGGFVMPTGAAGGLATGAGGTIQAFLRDTVTPYTMQWNFNVQRQLPGDSLLQVGYVGNRGLQLQRNTESGFDIDQVNPQYLSLGPRLNQLVDNPFYGVVNNGVLAARQVSQAQLLRPYPQYTSVVPLYSSGASSTYHGLQTRFTKRYSRGLQLDGSYTWSKVLDNGGADHQDSYNILADRAVTSYDVSHRFVVSYIYELPFGRGRRFGSSASPIVSAVLGGWQVNGITTVQSGTPLRITANNTSGLSNPTERANTNGNSPILQGDVHDRLNRYFDTSVFTQPAAFTLGNTAAYYGNLRSHYQNNTDLSLFKQFTPRERLRIQFRAEAFNVFNRVQFGSPNTSVNSTSFGVITSQANTPRDIQFGLKVLF
jgi:carboxypeptidase family protein